MARKIIFIITLIITTIDAADFAGKFGIAFTAGSDPTVGMRYHVNEFYCIAPFMGFQIGDYHAPSGVIYEYNEFILGAGNLFHLPKIPNFNHYINVEPAVRFGSREDYFRLSGVYGLQYPINRVISLFGELGIQIYLPDAGVNTFRSGVGCIFYFK